VIDSIRPAHHQRHWKTTRRSRTRAPSRPSSLRPCASSTPTSGPTPAPSPTTASATGPAKSSPLALGTLPAGRRSDHRRGHPPWPPSTTSSPTVTTPTRRRRQTLPARPPNDQLQRPLPGPPAAHPPAFRTLRAPPMTGPVQDPVPILVTGLLPAAPDHPGAGAAGADTAPGPAPAAGAHRIRA